MSEQLCFTVPPEFDGKQAKWFLKDYCTLSTRMITCLKREKEGILMNGKILRTVDLVVGGAVVVINLPEEESAYIQPVPGDLEIAYEDQYLLIVNKPPHMPVHPVKQHQTNTLANIVVYYSQSRGERYVFRALNRLDRDTSGLVMIAKDRFTVNKLKNRVNKVYFALVHGELRGSGSVREPIGLHDDSKIVRHVMADGMPAITHYTSLYSSKEYSFIKLELETGRTHQIRCHMSSIGHPLLGDDLYGGSLGRISRQALHCGEMCFSHPVTNESISLKTEIPQDMKKAVPRLS